MVTSLERNLLERITSAPGYRASMTRSAPGVRRRAKPNEDAPPSIGTAEVMALYNRTRASMAAYDAVARLRRARALTTSVSSSS